MMKIIAIGDNVVDYYKHQNKIYPGGNALNVAVLCKRLNVEYSSYIGILGNDMAAAHIIDVLEKEKVDFSRIRQGYGENGMAVVSLDEHGDRVFIGSNKGGIQSRLGIRLTPEDYSFIEKHDLLHTSVYSNIEHVLPDLKYAIAISFDFSTQTNEDYLEKVCPYVQYAFFSGSHLTEEECRVLMHKAYRLGSKVVCITRGADGVLLYNGEKVYRKSVIPTDVIDTLGAGDSFIAGFLVSYMAESSIEKALRHGAANASETCKNYGAFGYGLDYFPKNELAVQ